jgi:peptidoglycan hydrolase-like protein with peptidoglycan-binding domain
MGILLRLGSRGPDVTKLQSLLNSNLKPSPKLVTDGIFGGRTDIAVRSFQKASWLTVDGIVGPCTWNALNGTEAYVYYKPPFRLIPQPTADTCWAASTAMLTGMTVDQVVAKAKAAGVKCDNGLLNDSNRPDCANTSLFARTFSLTMLPPMSWLPGALAQVLNARGPLMMDTLWNPQDSVSMAGSPGHMRVIAGMRGDGTAEGTTILLYDPWPPKVGKIDPQIYGPFINRDPASTYQLFYR